MKLERIALGVDFTDPSLSAARWVARHLAPEAQLFVLHAIEIPRPPSFLEPAYPPRERIFEVARQGAQQQLEAFSRALAEGRPGPVRAETREGRASDRIAELAAETGADLIAVGEPAERQGVWRLLGSTAERLVHEAPVPVLIARGAPTRAPREILVPVDESAPAASALAWARFLASRWGARVTVLHAVPEGVIGHARIVSSPGRLRDLERELRELSARWLEGQVGAAGFGPGEARTVVAAGDERAEILAAAERTGAEIIVMGSRGAGAVGRALLGSVAAAVLRGAACSVLVVTDGGG